MNATSVKLARNGQLGVCKSWLALGVAAAASACWAATRNVSDVTELKKLGRALGGETVVVTENR